MKKTIEELLNTPYWIIDILPKRVPADSPGQYFAVEDYYLAAPRLSAVKQRHIDVILKLNCYKDLSLDEWASVNPPPEEIAAAMTERYLNILVEDSLIVSEPDDAHMTLFNPDGELLQLVKDLAAGEGLFVWKPQEGEKDVDFIVRPYAPGEENAVADAHRRTYSQEYGWNDFFTDYAARLALDFPLREPSDREALWIAEAEGRQVGSIMLCRTDDPSVGQLRLFLVDKDFRRCGIGAALIDALMAKAREAGFEKLILSTAAPLTEAIGIYERLGFHITEESETRDWTPDGSPVTEIWMEMTLA